MNNLNDLICHEQTYENFISKLKDKNLTIKEDDNLFLVSYPNNNEEVYMSDPIVNSCKGVIFQKSPLKIVCYTFSKTQECDMNDTSIIESLDLKSLRVEELIDGSFMKLYCVDGEWKVSTNRCINSKNANWNNYKTFYDMWEEARIECNIDYNNLDVNSVYGFVLCHPQNRIVTNYQSPHLVYISRFNINEKCEMSVSASDLTNEEKTNEEIELTQTNMLKHNIISRQFNFCSIAELLDTVKVDTKYCINLNFLKIKIENIFIIIYNY